MVSASFERVRKKSVARTCEMERRLLNFFRFFPRRNVSENCTTAACARTCRGNKVKAPNQRWLGGVLLRYVTNYVVPSSLFFVVIAIINTLSFSLERKMRVCNSPGK